MTIIHWFTLIRWKNIVMLLCTILLFRYAVIIPLAKNNLVLSNPFFYLLLLVVLLVAAAGYMINDVYDRAIDAVNNPARVLIGKSHALIKHIFLVYYLLNFLASILAFVVCWKLQKLNVFMMVLSCIVFLWLYAIRLKKMLLIGNLVISLLAALSIIIIGIFEQEIKIILASYILGAFAFLTTLLREYIKDVEDIDGDRRFGVTSLPIVMGVKRSKYYGFLVLLSIVSSLVFIAQILITKHLIWLACSIILLLILPYILIAFLLWKATVKKDYSRLSFFSKVLMLLGLLSLLFTTFVL